MSEIIAPIDKVVGIPIAIDIKTEGGIIIPEGGVQAEEFIKLISIGLDVKGYSVGDIVVTNPFAGKVFTIDRKTYKVFHPQELYATIKE